MLGTSRNQVCFDSFILDTNVLLTYIGHGEAAVKLQRDWNRNPQSLPFAQYIKTHALVSLVQKGLQYHEIEQTIDQARCDCVLLLIIGRAY